jgi:serine phosphatase RsbU (regulator of sigma subunit)
MEKQKMEEQLNVARDIQRHLWPRLLPNLPGYSIIGQSKPALEVG